LSRRLLSLQELEAAEMSRRIKAESAVKPEELVEEYEDVFTQIKEITNIIENEKLVANFIETEDKNFALFNLVNELNNNIELLREQIGDVEEATKGYKEEIEVTAVERKKVLVELEAKLTEETDRAATLVNRREETTEEVKELKEKVAEAFDETGCDAEVFEAKLGEKKTDESNLMQFLGLIEQRANELLQQQALINARATRKWEEEATKLIQQNALSADPKPDFDPANELPAKPEAPKGLLGAGPTVTTIGLIEPPSAIDDDDDDDDEDLNTRPLTMDELRQRVAASRTSKVSA
jgi:chromosome segregation ATPase